MATINSAAPTTDLANVMSFVANRNLELEAPAAQSLATPVAETAASPHTPAEQPAVNQQAKESTPPTPSNSLDYAGTFLVPVRGRKPKAIYVNDDIHTALATITQACPDNVGLSDLLINIITHHFETFGPGIRQFLTAQERLKKNKLPY